ncbi:hypothetical protein C0991_007534 [Blastosporella zonata]|nr:hypothetical protein C0991_007534 [Blastosporella zonata]
MAPTGPIATQSGVALQLVEEASGEGEEGDMGPYSNYEAPAAPHNPYYQNNYGAAPPAAPYAPPHDPAYNQDYIKTEGALEINLETEMRRMCSGSVGLGLFNYLLDLRVKARGDRQRPDSDSEHKPS